MATNEELKTLITEMKNDMVTKEKFDELKELIQEKNDKIDELEGRIRKVIKGVWTKMQQLESSGSILLSFGKNPSERKYVISEIL